MTAIKEFPKFCPYLDNDSKAMRVNKERDTVDIMVHAAPLPLGHQGILVDTEFTETVLTQM